MEGNATPRPAESGRDPATATDPDAKYDTPATRTSRSDRR
jgi:hypothetical protein